jgi:hypothetical protein
MMSTNQLLDFGGEPFSNSALFRERLCLTTRRTGTRLDGGKDTLGLESRPNRIALILCIITDLIPYKQPE